MRRIIPSHLNLSKKACGLFRQSLQFAARIICLPEADKFHTCSLSGIFCQVHAPAENGFYFIFCFRRKLCEASLRICQDRLFWAGLFCRFRVCSKQNHSRFADGCARWEGKKSLDTLYSAGCQDRKIRLQYEHCAKIEKITGLGDGFPLTKWEKSITL